MLFGTKQNLTKFDDIKLNYDSEEIERVDKFKYLGVILDPTLSTNVVLCGQISLLSITIGFKFCKIGLHVSFSLLISGLLLTN